MTASDSKSSSTISVDRKERLKTLADGYTTTKRKFEIFTLSSFSLCLIICSYQLTDVLSKHDWPIFFASIIVGLLITDLISGLVHWAFDTWGSLDTPLIGTNFIRSFREHHLDPAAMTRHDFIEVSSDSCILPLPLLAILALINPHPTTIFFKLVLSTTITTCFFVTFINQCHKWAHLRNNHPILRWMQQNRLILNPQEHNVHHTRPYDDYYCTFNGWMNPPLSAINFWRFLEDTITKWTGAIPRKDDVNWTASARATAVATEKTKKTE